MLEFVGKWNVQAASAGGEQPKTLSLQRSTSQELNN